MLAAAAADPAVETASAGYPSSTNTWEPAVHLEGCSALEAFEAEEEKCVKEEEAEQARKDEEEQKR